MKLSRTGMAVSALPSVFMLGLFYSLAFHMYRSLGGWPTSIGDHGFPPALVAHSDIAMYAFIVLVLFTIFVVPLGILVCLLRAHWRHRVRYFALYALSFALCWTLMQLAPAPFLYWWRD